MRATRWLWACAIAASLACGSATLAYGQGRGNGNGHNKHDRDDDDDQGKHKGKDKFRYSERDYEVVRVWYRGHESNLPPGLAKRDRLPPGLQRQLDERGTLPPGLRKKMVRCPIELERQLPPPPPECRHVFIGGSLVLVNTRTFLVVDVFHFDFHS
jgi:Ni/Co efflux regulator RcnB